MKTPAPGALQAVGRAATTLPVTVEKLKWDGSVSARSPGWLLDDQDGRRCWLLPAGLPRERPRLGRVERPQADTVYLAAGAWWVLSGQLQGDGASTRYTVDAALSPASPVEGWLRWVDLDLDLTCDDGSFDLLDEDDLARRARQMGYPPEVCDGAWQGINDAARRWADRSWPFDGWLAERLRSGVRDALGREVRPCSRCGRAAVRDARRRPEAEQGSPPSPGRRRPSQDVPGEIASPSGPCVERVSWYRARPATPSTQPADGSDEAVGVWRAGPPVAEAVECGEPREPERPRVVGGALAEGAAHERWPARLPNDGRARGSAAARAGGW